MGHFAEANLDGYTIGDYQQDRALDRRDIMSEPQTEYRFARHHHAALDRTLVDRTRLTIALYELLTAVQVGEPVALKDAEAAAIDVLVSVGGRPQEALQEEA